MVAAPSWSQSCSSYTTLGEVLFHFDVTRHGQWRHHRHSKWWRWFAWEATPKAPRKRRAVRKRTDSCTAIYLQRVAASDFPPRGWDTASCRTESKGIYHRLRAVAKTIAPGHMMHSRLFGMRYTLRWQYIFPRRGISVGERLGESELVFSNWRVRVSNGKSYSEQFVYCPAWMGCKAP